MKNQITLAQKDNISNYMEHDTPDLEIAESGLITKVLNGPNGKIISVTFGVVTVSFLGLIAFGMLNDFTPSLKIDNLSLSFARCQP